MNAQNVESKPKVRKETKNKIRVDFERTPLKERLKAKFLSMYFVKRVLWWIVRYVLLVGVAYIVLFPFFSKISASFMAKVDFTDATVRLIPKHFSLEIYKEIWIEQEYVRALGNTLSLALSTALIQTFICSFIAYGFAKFKFKGNKTLFMLVLLTLIIPHRTLSGAMKTTFSGFDVFGLFGFLNGGGINIFGFEYTNDALATIKLIPAGWERFTSGGIDLLNSYWPFILLSLCGLAFKNGLYIFLLRQFFMGVPDELEESAYIGGSGVFRTFFTIILPLSIPMMVTVFLFSFSWCWTDNFYTSGLMFFPDSGSAPYLLTSDIGTKIPSTLTDSNFAAVTLYEGAVRNTGGLMIIIPLVIMYVFCQKSLVQGIERSGLTAD
jgi:multiple sugar transport system permease protein